jgi:catechol 2,3-dioxygenase-like lactoylglutathione lyase family enzyme
LQAEFRFSPIPSAGANQMIRGVHHVAISTPDLQRLLGFYRDLLGFDVIAGSQSEWGRGATVIDNVLGLKNSVGKTAMLRAGNLCIEFFQFSEPVPTPMKKDRPVCDHGHTHLCIDVRDIESEYRRLCVAGVEFHAPPQHFPEMGLKATYGRDPDGNVFELQEILDADHSWQVNRN